MDLLFSHRIDKIMLYSDYWENDVITSCIPMVKHVEKKFVSAVIVTTEMGAVMNVDESLHTENDQRESTTKNLAKNTTISFMCPVH